MSAVRSRTALSVICGTMVLLAAACGGPRVPLDVGIREVPGDVVLGSDRSIRRVIPVPPVSLPIAPPSGARLSDLTDYYVAPRATAPPPADPCPSADPREAAVIAAPNTITRPPSPGDYGFRNDGTFEVSGPNAARGTLGVDARRVVKDVFALTRPGASEASWYRFDVEAALHPVASTTTTTYTLVPESDASVSPGLYISRVRTEFSDGTSEDFRPANFPGLLLAPFPLTQGRTWEAAGTDPRSATTMAFTGRVDGKRRIDACGVPLDAIVVHIDGRFGGSDGDGIAVSPQAHTRFVADYALGTQFGGLSLMDSIEARRAFLSGNLHVRNVSTIDVEPGRPMRDVPPCDAGCVAP